MRRRIERCDVALDADGSLTTLFRAIANGQPQPLPPREVYAALPALRRARDARELPGNDMDATPIEQLRRQVDARVVENGAFAGCRVDQHPPAFGDDVDVPVDDRTAAWSSMAYTRHPNC